MPSKYPLHSPLEPVSFFGSVAAMNFVLALLFFLVVGAVLTIGIAMAAKGAAWLLIAGVVVFIGLFIKYGCLTH